jgi:hypothetical protein
MEVASDIGAWGRCHPQPSIFEGMFQIPAKKIDKSTSTINKFDLGHKNHKNTAFLCQPNLSTNLQKKLTDQQTALVFWETDLKFVDTSTNFKSVDLSILQKINRSTDQQSTNLVFWDKNLFFFTAHRGDREYGTQE